MQSIQANILRDVEATATSKGGNKSAIASNVLRMLREQARSQGVDDASSLNKANCLQKLAEKTMSLLAFQALE